MRINNTKALSPIFATLIILAVVTILFIPVFIWATGTTSQTQESWQTSGLIATERIVIEEVNLKADTPSCTIYVRNIGKTAVTVDNIFVSSSDGNPHTYVSSDLTANPDSVVQGDLITITIPDLHFSPTNGTAYTVKVFTIRGVGDAYQVVA